MNDIIENIFLTGLLFFAIMIIVPNIFGKDAPFWVKASIIVPGLVGIVAMITALVLWIWV